MASIKDSTVRNWADMERDILLKIFMLLNVMDLTSGISSVCTSWRAACFDPILWKKLDFSTVNSHFFNVPRESNAWSDDQKSSDRMMGILKSALYFSSGNILCLIFHFHVFITNEHLLYAAERSPNLKRLVLPAWTQITVVGFENAIMNWKGLESLTVPSTDDPVGIMNVIGTYCQNFSMIKIMCPFAAKFAGAIVAFTPKLKILSIRCTMVGKRALAYVLNKMEYLEVLTISHCLLMDDSQYPNHIVLSPDLDDSIIEQASRLKKFFICQRESCLVCQHMVKHDGIMMWAEREEGILQLFEDRTCSGRTSAIDDAAAYSTSMGPIVGSYCGKFAGLTGPGEVSSSIGIQLSGAAIEGIYGDLNNNPDDE